MPTTSPTPLPTAKEFKNATTPSLTGIFYARHHIGIIDKSLESWERKVSLTSAWDEKKKILSEIISLCETWNRTKGAKKEKGLCQQRAGEVEELGVKAFEWLKFCTFEGAKGDFQTDTARSNFGIAPSNPQFNNLKSLDAGYSVERDSYLANGKQAATSMGAVHGVHSKMTAQQMAAMGVTDPAVQAVLQKQFDQLTPADVITLDRAMGQLGISENVWFMTKTERMAYMLVVMNGELYRGPSDKFTTGGRMYMYAMNKYGNVFCISPNADSPVQQPTGGGDPFMTKLNHSSLNAGNDIVCAGEIQERLGYWTINNNSGHYKPSAQNMQNAIVMLRDDGLDLAGWAVGVRQPNGDLHYFQAAAFCGSANLPAASRIVALDS